MCALLAAVFVATAPPQPAVPQRRQDSVVVEKMEIDAHRPCVRILMKKKRFE